MKPFAELVHDELNRARQLHPQPQSSAHHGWAVLMEEVDELWDQVRLRGEKRDHQNMLTELVQIGAMAQRMAEEVVMAKLGVEEGITLEDRKALAYHKVKLAADLQQLEAMKRTLEHQANSQVVTGSDAWSSLV